ncbi:MAG: EAL domain-containing protein [Bacillota bacterium]|nr:EAL domain-containing protein [Bacillota bacterium]
MRNLSLGKTLKSPNLIIGLIFLTCMCMVARIYKVPLSYGVYISFSSFFLFVILRLYGTVFGVVSSVFVNIFVIIFLHSDTISLFVPLEILVVGIIYKSKTQNLFLSEMIYWLILGCPITSLFFFLQGGEFGIEGFVAVLNQFVIGLINALLADMMISYISPQRMLRSNANYTIDFSILLFHFTLLSVLGPFTIFVSIDGLNINRDTNISIIQTIENKKFDIMEQLKGWSIIDLRKIKVKSPIQLNKLKNILDKEPEGSIVGLMIQDNNGKVYASNKQANNYDISDDWKSHGKITQLSDDIYIWHPELTNYYTDETAWKSAFFIKETKFEDIDLKLVIKIPLLKYSEEIWDGYLNKFYIIIIACIIATILSIIISRFLSGALLKLAESTTDIPNKLGRQEKINWPNTSISQIKSLILNFTEMSNKLEQLFSQEKEMNNKLLVQTDEMKKSKEELKHLAYYDALTDLPNRHYFIDYLKKTVEEDENKYKILAIMFIDLNRFKQINDSLGHEVGDMLLKEIARRFKAISKNYSFIARLGGDEFVIILENADKLKAAETANFINKILADKIDIVYNSKRIELFTSGSIGISMYPMDSNDINTVLKNADIAMYAAKKTGGNIYRFYEEINKDNKEEQIHLEMNLKSALERKELVLYYQPQFNVKSGNITAVEALLRWNHPELGLILPSKFIPIANNIGLMQEIGYWVLKEACAQIKLWRDMGIINTRVTVNLSGDNFESQYIIDTIQKVLDETGVSPELLGLDITESYLLSNFTNLDKTVSDLKQLGVYISIDDFGEGGSSISLLKDAPVDCVKIDRIFIEKLSTDKKSELIVKALIDMVHSIGIKVVAEGVETPENVDILKNMDCDDIHGFLLRAPMDKNNFENWLINYNNQRAVFEL